MAIGKRVGKKAGKKAAKATFRHTVRGYTAKAQRRPLRSVTLLTAGGLIGAAAGFIAGRKVS
jgi:hypothetical protein